MASSNKIPQWVKDIDDETILLKGNWYRATKRMLDIVLVILILPVVALILLLCTIAIKIEDFDAPVIYSQLRTGRGGKLFRMFKFRTMVPNAEELKESYAHLNELVWPDFKIKDDPRITKVGKILRKTSLDELPQIFNIIAGNMSSIGPRPTSFGPDQYNIWHTERFDVLPGVTGLWQVLGRGSTQFDDKLRLDIIYVKKRCIKLDLIILIRTIPVILTGRGAY